MTAPARAVGWTARPAAAPAPGAARAAGRTAARTADRPELPRSRHLGESRAVRGLLIGIALAFLLLFLFVPLVAVFAKAFEKGAAAFAAAVREPDTLAASLINAVFGLLLAWVLERYTFPGKRLIDMLVDLPFALPTAVAGIALASVYAGNGWLGRWLEPAGIHVAFTPLGVMVALTFVGLPFVVRTVQPVLRELSPEIEEAAATLGAGRGQTFLRVILPEILPATMTGATLAFARALGEYGSVIFIAGNMPMRSEITPLLIMIKLEQFDYAGATAIALVFLLVSFSLLLFINMMAHRRRAPSAG